MRFDGAIFDVDGVLVDSPHERAWRESLEKLMDGPWRDGPGARYRPGDYTSAFYQTFVAGKPREAGARAALERFGIADPDGRRVREYAEAKQARLVELIDQGDFRAFEDALRLLLAVKTSGVRTAAASSSRNADMLLGRVQLAEHFSPDELHRASVQPGATLLEIFDADVSGRRFARGKPDPEIFLTAAAELRMPPERAFVVEDAPSGVLAAKSGGMACVGVARLDDEPSLRSAGADWVVSSLDLLDVDVLLGRASGDEGVTSGRQGDDY